MASFDAIAAGEGVFSYERTLINDDPAGGLAHLARYADLVVLSQTDHDDPVSRVISDVPEYVMLNGGGPVLIMPYAGHFHRIGSKVLVAWNDGIEAARALANAIPMLKRADKVTLAVFNAQDAEGRSPGADIALRLARHGVNCEAAAERSTIDIGNGLLSLAADLQTDLIVMGGYGHTRFRELLLGGVTATLLHTMTVPVLMSH